MDHRKQNLRFSVVIAQQKFTADIHQNLMGGELTGIIFQIVIVYLLFGGQVGFQKVKKAVAEAAVFCHCVTR